MKPTETLMLRKNSLFLLAIILLILILRFLVTLEMPFMDPTEARYGEIARIMWEKGELLTLYTDYEKPFLAKPPFSTWASALSFSFFGVTEGAGRFPSFLIGIFLILSFFKFFRKEALLSSFVLTTTPLFIIQLGTVMTDSYLLFSTTFIMISFWFAMKKGASPLWQPLLFFSLGLGFLVKGLLPLALTLPVFAIWSFKEKTVFQKISFKWLPITFLVAAPWYLFMENKYPGFLHYFFVGEHWSRFLEPSWKGDLYGFPSKEPFGMIWIYALLTFFPWGFFLIPCLIKKGRGLIEDSWLFYLTLWFLWPLLFFTFCQNILYTYNIPLVYPLALLTVYFLKESKRKGLFLNLSLFSPILGILILWGVWSNKEFFKDNFPSDHYLLQDERVQKEDSRIYYLGRRSFTGQYYTKGRAQEIKDLGDIKTPAFVLIEKHKKISKGFQKIMRRISSNKKRTLYYMKE